MFFRLADIPLTHKILLFNNNAGQMPGYERRLKMSLIDVLKGKAD